MEQVKPLIEQKFPGVKYAAALLGAGSEVLGYDDEISQDHDWGPRLQLFLREEAIHLREEIIEYLRYHFPAECHGFSNNWGSPGKDGTRTTNQDHNESYVDHKVEIYTLDEFLLKLFGHSKREWTVQDWLMAPEQRLLVFTAGKVYEDQIGELTAMREYLTYYPDPIWYYCIRGEMSQLYENMAFAGRARMVGDEIGTRLIAAKQVERIVNVAFLLERRYQPYQKWVGTAFKSLDIASKLEKILIRVLGSSDWKTREDNLNQSYLILGEVMERLGIMQGGEIEITQFYSRPIEIVRMEIDKQSPYVTNKLLHDGIIPGSVNQVVRDRTLLSHIDIVRKVFDYSFIGE